MFIWSKKLDGVAVLITDPPPASSFPFSEKIKIYVYFESLVLYSVNELLTTVFVEQP